MRHLVLALCLLAVPATAAAGDRAYWLTIVDGSVTPGAAGGAAEQLARAFLRCQPAETLDVCKRRIGPENQSLYSGDVQYYPPAPSLSAAAHGHAVRNQPGARRALDAAYENNEWGLDGLIVIDVGPRAVTVVVFAEENGRPFGRARANLRDGRLEDRDVERIVRTIMRPIQRRFSP